MMKDLMQKYPKHVAIILGVASGIPPGLDRLTKIPFGPVAGRHYAAMLLLALLAPPIGVTIGNFMKPGLNARVLRAINKYINVYLLIVSGSLTMGLSGIALHFLLPDRQIPLPPFLFFCCGGIGFLLAYFLDKHTGYRYEKLPNQAL